MGKSSGSKTLKDQNRWQLWLVIAANAIVFYVACQWATIALAGIGSALTGAANLLPIGLAVVVTTIANGLLPAKLKDRLVFLRWNDALPGHRAFSVHAKQDPRIDFTRLQRSLGNKLPPDPKTENAAWYRFYLEVQNVAAVQQVHRDYLLLRDCTGLAALFVVCFGLPAFFLVPTTQTFVVYIAFLVFQALVVRQAAATYGVRFVCTVLAQKAGKSAKAAAAH
jgi:hypothetical protein